MKEIISYLVTNVDSILFAVSAVVAAASAVAALTPTPKDDSIVAKVYKVVDWLALNVGKAKDKWLVQSFSYSSRSQKSERCSWKYEPNMLKNLHLVVIVSTALILMSGCATLRESRIPEFIEELNQHEFSSSERETIGEILDYVNDLENIVQ